MNSIIPVKHFMDKNILKLAKINISQLCFTKNSPANLISVRNRSCFKRNSTTNVIGVRSQHQQKPQHQDTVEDPMIKENEVTTKLIDKVNHLIDTNSYGRLFAVVQVQAKQFKVTTEDIIVLQGYWPPVNGDELRLEKVLLVGSKDFTLIGRPLLPLDQVAVHATVIEKTLTDVITWFHKRPRKNDMKTRYYQHPLTYLRIKSITLTGRVNELGDTDGLQGKLF